MQPIIWLFCKWLKEGSLGEIETQTLFEHSKQEVVDTNDFRKIPILR